MIYVATSNILIYVCLLNFQVMSLVINVITLFGFPAKLSFSLNKNKKNYKNEKNKKMKKRMATWQEPIEKGFKRMEEPN